MLGKKKSVVGLDIGSNTLKAVELTRDKEGVTLTGFARLELPPDGNRRDAIADLFRRGGFRTRRVVVAVSGKSLIVRYVTMPRMSSEELRRSLPLDLDKHIPLPPEETQFDWQVLGEAPAGVDGGEPGMRIVLVGVKRTLVVDLANMLFEVGLVPLAIDADVFALGNAFALASTLAPPGAEEDRAVALVDVGASKTCIHVVAGGASQFAREVPVGGNDLTSAIARRLNADAADAEGRKREPGDRLEDVREAVGPVLEDLTNEVSLSFDYYEHASGGSVGAVWLSGGSALAPYLAESFERAMERRTRVWNPIEGLQVRADALDNDDLQTAGPSLAVALGLAARGSGVLSERAA